MKKVIVLSLFVFLFVGSYFLLYFNLLDFIEYVGDERISRVKDYSPSLSFLFSAPLAFFGFIVVLYRTYQAEKQISMMMQQNIFSNHYKHKEEFVKFVERQDREYFDEEYSYDLYGKLFSLSKSGYFNIPDKVIGDVRFYVDNINEQIVSLFKLDNVRVILNEEFLILYCKIIDFNSKYGASSTFLTEKVDLTVVKAAFEKWQRPTEYEDYEYKEVVVEQFIYAIYHYFSNLKLLNHIYKHFCSHVDWFDNPFNKIADVELKVFDLKNIVCYEYSGNIVYGYISEASKLVDSDYSAQFKKDLMAKH